MTDDELYQMRQELTELQDNFRRVRAMKFDSYTSDAAGELLRAINLRNALLNGQPRLAVGNDLEDVLKDVEEVIRQGSKQLKSLSAAAQNQTNLNVKALIEMK